LSNTNMSGDPEIDALSTFTLSTKVEVKPILTQDKINAVQRKLRSLDNFPLEETRTRNLLMLGRSGSGKSTAICIIKDTCALPQPQSLFSDTVGPRFQSFSLDDKRSKMKYSVNIIDTPGVQEVKPMGENARSDGAILETIKYCLKNEITRIHTLMIFASFEGRLSELDYEAFKIYLEMFYDKKVSIAFCITRSEGRDQAWRDSIVSDLKQDKYFSKMLEIHSNIKIFFTGCVDQTRVNEATDVTTLFLRYNEIYNYREQLLSFVFESSDDGVMLMDLPIVSTSKHSMQEKLDKQNEILAKLEATNDFTLGPIQELIDTFAQNIAYMVENDGMFSVPALYQSFVEIKAKLRGLVKVMKEKNVSPATITKLTSRVIL